MMLYYNQLIHLDFTFTLTLTIITQLITFNSEQ